MKKLQEDMPKWLRKAKYRIESGRLEHFTIEMLHITIRDVLEDSCFYLSAGADITPIVAFKDIIYSYILCDEYLYDSIKGVDNKFNGILVKVKDRLIQQEFFEIQKFNIDKHFVGIKDRYWGNGYVSRMKNCEISFWSRENKIYSAMYINHHNTCAYTDLYIKNDIMPKAICEILSEGGSLCSSLENQGSKLTLTVEEKKNVLPEYVLGHTYSIGDIAQYEKLPDKVEYFGDYGPEYGSSSAMQIHKRMKLSL
ncbi:MAG: hypothetical protein NW241_04970 [Bacteroidia bacterium]|nr:hypothetical protein [Bacteroidia bacterium]